MKKKKTIKKAQYGYDIQPIQPLGMQQLPINTYIPPAQQVPASPLPTFESSKPAQVPNILSQAQGVGGGSVAGTVGSTVGSLVGGPIGGAVGGAIGNTIGQVGKFVNKLTSTGLSLANALIPEQDKTRYSQALPMSYNPYPQGTGSQAIYENGGYVTKTKKKRGISVTEEVPITPFEPTVIPQQFQEPTFDTATNPTVDYEPIYNSTGDLAYFTPRFKSFSRNQAMQTMQSLPDQYGNIPVLKSPELYSDLYTNFMTEQNSNNWIPSTNYNIAPIDNTNFQKYKSGGKIGPYITHDPKDPRIKRYNDSLNLYNKARSISSDLYLDDTEYTDKDLIKFDRNFTKEDALSEVSSLSKDSKSLNEYLNVYNEGKNKGILPSGYYPAKGPSLAYTKPKQEVVYESNPQIDPIPLESSYTMPIDIEIPLPEQVQVPEYGPKSYRMDYMGGLRRVYKNGGYIKGQEVDLSPEEIQSLINQGYQIQF